MLDNKYRLITLLIAAALIFSFFTIYIYSEKEPTLSARAAALYEPETETFIFSKNENEHLAMASTTKIMTALIALERLDEGTVITAGEGAVGIEGSSIWLEEGEAMSAADLVYALMLQSANDAAAALAIEVAGSTEAFAELMNERARALGIEDTNFVNPHGLDAEGHYTTAHDLAIIAAEALRNERFKEIASTYKKEIASSERTRTLVNHNKLLKSYEGCIGVKTGYTQRSGRSLVSAAERDGLTLIAVTIDAPDDWSDHRKMLDGGYAAYEALCLAAPEQFAYEIPVLGGERESVRVANSSAFKLVRKRGAGAVEAHVKLARYCAAPVREGDILGEVIFTENDRRVGEVYLTAAETINEKNKKRFFIRS